jgi:hypothetical protein
MVWKKLIAILLAAGEAFALGPADSHTHNETPMPPNTREIPQISQAAVAPIEIWITDSMQNGSTNGSPIVWRPSWA